MLTVLSRRQHVKIFYVLVTWYNNIVWCSEIAAMFHFLNCSAEWRHQTGELGSPKDCRRESSIWNDSILSSSKKRRRKAQSKSSSSSGNILIVESINLVVWTSVNPSCCMDERQSLLLYGRPSINLVVCIKVYHRLLFTRALGTKTLNSWGVQKATHVFSARLIAIRCNNTLYLQGGIVAPNC